MNLKLQPWSVWHPLGQHACHFPCLYTSSSPVPIAQSASHWCWHEAPLIAEQTVYSADGDRHFSQLQGTAVQSSSLDGSITVRWAEHSLRPCDIHIEKDAEGCIAVLTIKPNRDTAQTFLLLSVSGNLLTRLKCDMVYDTHMPSQSFALQKALYWCAYCTVGDSECVPDAMYPIVGETFQVTV